jgi:hypothetical protein
MDLIQFKSGFVALVGDGKQSNAMNGAGRGSQFGNVEPKLVPGKIDEINEGQQCEAERDETVPTKTGIGRENGGAGHRGP